MPRNPKFTPYRQGDAWLIHIPPAMTASGERRRKSFPTKALAEAAAAKLRASHKSGLRGSVIPVAVAKEAQAAIALLEPLGISLIEAARIVARTHQDQDTTKFRERWITAQDQSAARWSDRYQRDVAKLDRWLPPWFMQSRCSLIDKTMVEKALVERGPLARSTIETRKRYVMAILHHRPRHARRGRPEILTPEQIQAMLAACRAAEETRVIALLLYAGIRPEAESGEISRLRWDAVRGREIYIAAEVSKTKTDRIIPIRPVLKRLLAGHPTSGHVTPPNWQRTWKRIRKEAGITAADVTRHTFASHHLVAYGEEATKNAMGHTAGSSTLFRHYRAAVNGLAAKAYFK